jgi:PIN like domain
MNYLLDESLAQATAAALRDRAAVGDRFVHLLDIAPPGSADEEVVAICRRGGHDVLVTVGSSDHDARSRLHAALLERGLHVLAVRPGRAPFDVARQIDLLAAHQATAGRRYAAASAPTLLHLTPSGVAERAG